MSEGAESPILLVSADAERRLRATAALDGLGAVVQADDISSAFSELSLIDPLVAVLDGAFPEDGIAGVLGAIGDPDRVLLWVAEIRLDLLEYGALVQIPYDAEDRLFAAAVTRLAELQRIKREASDQKDLVGRYDHVIEVVRHVQYEINNPLTALLAETQLMLLDADRLSAEHRNSLQNIETMAERIRKLVKRLGELTAGG